MKLRVMPFRPEGRYRHARAVPPNTADTRGTEALKRDPSLSGSRRLIVFAIVSLALLMSSIDQTIVATGLPVLQHGLRTSINWAGWTITAYSFGQILALPVAGTLTQRYGRRRLFIASILLFTLASLACGLVDNIYLLIALRGVQAIGGAGFTPSATGIIVMYFGSARDKAVGLFGSIFSIGAVIGPILGGLVIGYWSWRAIFLVNVPIGIVLLVLCVIFIPRDNHENGIALHRLDVPGMGLLGLGVLSGMVGISYLGEPGAHVWSPLFVGVALLSVLGLTMFLHHISYAVDPLILPRLVYGKGFGVMNSINALYGGAAAGIGSLVPLFAVRRYGISVLNSGLLLTARGIAVILFASAGAFALRRTGYRRPMAVGFVLTGVGLLALAAPPQDMSAYLWLAATSTITGIGLGWSGPATRNASLQLAPEQAATIAALRTMGRQVGSIVSVSIATAVLAQASDPGLALAKIFAIFALILLVATPVVRRVPEHRGAW